MKIKDKGSLFNLFFQRDGNYLLYNTLNLKLYRIEKSMWDALKTANETHAVGPVGENALEVLRAERLILSHDTDELAYMNHLLHSVIYENKLSVTIIPTEACNFRCGYCYEPHDNHHMTDDVEHSILKFFQRNIRKYKSVAVDWFGGEPLLQKQRVLRIMQVARELCNTNGIPLYSTMITNGYLLDVDTFDALVENKVFYYQITLDTTKTVHDKRRPFVDGGGTFDTIFKNIMEIKKQAKHKYFRITIRSNVGKQDGEAYQEFLNTMLALVGDDPRFVFSCEQIHDWGGESVKDLQAEIFEQRQLFSQSIASAIFAKHANVFLEDFSSLSAGRCSAGKMNGFLMNYDGLLYKCGMASCGIPENKAIGHIGNLKTNGVAEIDELKNSRFLAIAKPGEQCETCPWLPRCLMSNCPLSHAKGEKLRCIKEYMGKSYIEDILWNMYSCRKYIDLI